MWLVVFFYTSSPVKQCRHLQLLAHNIFTIAHNPPSGGATQRHRLELNVLVHLFTLLFLFFPLSLPKWDFVMATLKDEGVVSTANASRAVKTPNGRFRLFILWALAEKKTAESVMSFLPPHAHVITRENTDGVLRPSPHPPLPPSRALSRSPSPSPLEGFQLVEHIRKDARINANKPSILIY